jgi:phytoene dehydrogenase-like protein
MVFYWAMDRAFPELAVHNILFSADYPREFAEIFDIGQLPKDPTVYINITSKVTAGDAPQNGENWFVLVNTPHHRGQDWTVGSRIMRETILHRIERQLGSPVASHIAQEKVLTPQDIERDTASTFGSLYGISSNSALSAFMRHPNRSRRYRGLYFCGASAHPGGGMPLVVLSGKIAADLVRRYDEL